MKDNEVDVEQYFEDWVTGKTGHIHVAITYVDGKKTLYLDGREQ